MKIERIEDKKFMITLSEKEALKLADSVDLDWDWYTIYKLHIGRTLLPYFMLCCQFPNQKQPSLEKEL